MLTRTCNSTRRHAEEIISNLHTLQHAHQHLNDPTIDPDFKQQLLSILPGKKPINKHYIYPHRETKKINSFATILFPQNELTFFNKIQIGNLKLCTYASAISKQGDDSTIVYRTADNFSYMGRIQAILSVSETEAVFLVIQYPIITDYFICSLGDDKSFTNTCIQHCLKKNYSTRLIKPTDIIEKCLYYEHPTGKCTFMRFPFVSLPSQFYLIVFKLFFLHLYFQINFIS